MDQAARLGMIERYEQGYDAVVEAMAGLTEDGLGLREAPGEWSIREIVHHLGDTEMTVAVRFRMVIAHDQPLIVGFDQDEFARDLFYDRPIENSLQAFKYARASTGEILRRLDESAWARTANHTEYGVQHLDNWLAYFSEHAHDHAAQIRAARAAGAV